MAFMRNPLVIRFRDCFGELEDALIPFMPITSDVVMKFATQSLEELKTKVLTARKKAQQQLQQDFDDKKEEIITVYREEEERKNSRNI